MGCYRGEVDRMKTKLPKEKWTPSAVRDFILACRRDKGIPMFKTKYAGIPLEIDHSPVAIAICWAGEDFVDSKVFTDVPKEDLHLLEEGFGDWKRLLRKYGTEKEFEEANKYGIYIRSANLPRFQTRGLVVKIV